VTGYGGNAIIKSQVFYKDTFQVEASSYKDNSDFTPKFVNANPPGQTGNEWTTDFFGGIDIIVSGASNNGGRDQSSFTDSEWLFTRSNKLSKLYADFGIFQDSPYPNATTAILQRCYNITSQCVVLQARNYAAYDIGGVPQDAIDALGNVIVPIIAHNGEESQPNSNFTKVVDGNSGDTLIGCPFNFAQLTVIPVTQ
jgi:hypothetical protein